MMVLSPCIAFICLFYEYELGQIGHHTDAKKHKKELKFLPVLHRFFGLIHLEIFLYSGKNTELSFNRSEVQIFRGI